MTTLMAELESEAIAEIEKESSIAKAAACDANCQLYEVSKEGWFINLVMQELAWQNDKYSSIELSLY